MCWRFVVQIILALSRISLHFSYQYNVHSTSRFYAANRVNHLLATDLSRPSASITSPVAINKIITTVFSPDSVKNETTFLRLKVYLEKNAQSMNDVNAITLLHRCAKFKKNVTALISMRRIVSLIQAGRPNAQGIANALYSLHAFPASTPEVSELLQVLHLKLASCTDKFDGQCISNSLYGLKNFDASTPGAVEVLSAIVAQIERSTSQTNGMEKDAMSKNSTSSLIMSPQGIGCAFLGIQNMGGNDTHRLLSHLARVTTASTVTTPLDGQAVGNVLVSLRSFSSEVEEVRLVLQALVDSIRRHPSTLHHAKSAELSMSFWGLQNMSPEYKVVEDIMDVLIHAIEREDSNFRFARTEEVLYAIGGLRGMSQSNRRVRRLLKIFSTTARNSISEPSSTASGSKSATITQIAFGSAVFGLQSMSEGVEVADMVSALSKVLNYYQLPLSDVALANAIYGLQGMRSDSRQVRYLLKSLLKHFVLPADLDCPPQHITMMLYGLRSMSTCSETEQMLHTVLKLMQQSSSHLSPQSIATAFFGLQNMDDTLLVRKVCAALGKHLSGKASADGSRVNGQEISMILHGLRNIGSECSSIRDLLLVIASRVDECSSMSWPEICTSLNGLQSMGGGKALFSVEGLSNDVPYALARVLSDGVAGSRRKNLLPQQLNSILVALSKKAEITLAEISDCGLQHQQKRSAVTSASVASAVYGLQGLSADSAVVKRLILTIASALELSYSYSGSNGCNRSGMDGQSIASILYGLQNMTARAPQVRRLLSVIEQGVRASNCTFNPQVVGNSLYGLQGFGSEIVEVRALLSAIAIKIRAMPVACSLDAQFTGQNIGNALWGLRNMSSEHVEVREVMAALLPHIERSSALLSGQNFGNALYAFNRMSDAFDEVRAILAALAFKLFRSSAELSGLDIGMALFGMRGMDASSTPEVQVLLGILLHKIRSGNHTLQLSELSLAIVGLLGSSPWIKDDFIRVLASRTAGMTLLTANDTPEDDPS